MTITTSLVPHVIDALVTKIEGLNPISGLTDAQGNPISLIVYDGYPGPNFEDTFVCVGGSPKPTARSRQRFVSLGGTGVPGSAPAKDEDTEILCYAQAGTGGGADPNPVSGSDNSQQLCRNNAYAIVGAVETSIRQDPTLLGLGGAASNFPLLSSGWCDVLAGDLYQTSEVDAANGRYAVVEFTVHYFDRLRSA